MRSSKPKKAGEVRDLTQLGLDFSQVSEYINVPRKEYENMNQELFEALEKKVDDLLQKYNSLKDESIRLVQDNQRLTDEREGLKGRVDAILGKLEGI